MRPSPTDLSTFLAIARHRSFRRAAADLGVTPSALSHALRSLEERIDIRLFNRTSRSVSLTEAGERLYARVQPAFRDIEEALDELNSFRDAPMGTLRLNAAHSAAQRLLLPLVNRFVKTYPSVSVELMVQSAMVDVVSEGFDAGVRFGETIAADMIAVPLGPRQRSVVVATQAFFARWPKPATPHDLGGLPCLRFRYYSGRDYRWEFERDGVKLEIAVDGPFVTNSQDLMVQAALEDVGIAYLFEGEAQDHIASGRLVRVLEDWCPDYAGYFLYYPSRRQMPTALRAFVDFMREKPGRGERPAGSPD